MNTAGLWRCKNSHKARVFQSHLYPRLDNRRPCLVPRGRTVEIGDLCGASQFSTL